MKCYNEACFHCENNNCDKQMDKIVCRKRLDDPLLKYGDEIEVFDDNLNEWVRRFFIALGKKTVLCFSPLNPDTLIHWKQWRRPSPSLTWEDRDKLRGKWIKHKSDKREEKIVAIEIIDDFLQINGEFIDDIIEHWEFIDGTPIK